MKVYAFVSVLFGNHSGTHFVTGVSGDMMSQFKQSCANCILCRVRTENMMACVSCVRNILLLSSLVTCEWMSIGEELSACTKRANANQIHYSLTARVAILPNERVTDESLFWAYCMQPFKFISLSTSSMVGYLKNIRSQSIWHS